jgi:hypothetical protein
MTSMRYPIALLTIALTSAGHAAAQTQDLPTTQPALVTIYRETVKAGRGEEHSRLEAGWPAAYGRANSPDYYLAMSSLTGVPEAWFITPFATHAAQGESMLRESTNPTLSAELSRLSRADADLLDGLRIIQASARPDLSSGKFPNLNTQRFWEITIFRVRPGREPEFAAAAKAYGAASLRAAPNTSYRVYEVIAGMPNPTYIVFASVAQYGEFDRMMADGMKTMQGANAEEQAALQKLFTDGLLSAETNRFRLDPRMSYVSAATRATDPAFWNPPAPRRTGSN